MTEKSNADKLRDEVQAKIQKLVQEFAGGKISNEQFNIIYARYNNQLQFADQAERGEDAIKPGEGVSTIAIREATTGKAIGISIYHHTSSTTIETLGNFDVSPSIISPVLNDITLKRDKGEFMPPYTRNLDKNIWIIFTSRLFCTMITLFQNEPSRVQVRHLERLHHDFEVANERFLKKNNVDASKLARPFLSLVRGNI
ncbi:MAG: hypothetical protein ACPG7F_11605 [Aggregatilineales bacterium]